jgi:hypothetical protein
MLLLTLRLMSIVLSTKRRDCLADNRKFLSLEEEGVVIFRFYWAHGRSLLLIHCRCTHFIFLVVIYFLS